MKVKSQEGSIVLQDKRCKKEKKKKEKWGPAPALIPSPRFADMKGTVAATYSSFPGPDGIPISFSMVRFKDVRTKIF